MTDRHREETQAYCVSIIYCSGTEPYARESAHLFAADEFDAERLARGRARDSAYHNERIPDLNLVVMVDAVDPTEPDDDPPIPMARSPGRPGCAESCKCATTGVATRV